MFEKLFGGKKEEEKAPTVEAAGAETDPVVDEEEQTDEKVGL